MRRLTILSLAAVSALSLGGCNSPYPQDRAVSGAVVGGAAGALIGGAATGKFGGAAVGGVLGAVTGAVIGANSRPAYYPPPPRPVYVYAPPPPPCMQFAYDAYGRRFCVARY